MANVKENVNHPDHYNTGKIEVIEYIEDLGFGRDFCLGNAIKYIARAGKKNPEKEIEDLKKAVWYIQRYIDTHTEQVEEKKTPWIKVGGKEAYTWSYDNGTIEFYNTDLKIIQRIFIGEKQYEQLEKKFKGRDLTDKIAEMYGDKE